ncbi:hypothetical protein SeLEV6574_g02771 [Synchytrium endobioticum]|uniref:Svf1-like C-terminal domain-containing protein n=1 Tax=Synchytrium endobioticum TaxID=286115 RepID=A0A507D6T9_9FUNG|nr:hypothetical protein SeLEV6574_g02771 [Synchytrium endobioticum]
MAEEAQDTQLDPETLEWHLEPSWATEGQTFYLHTKDGGFAILQMVYSSMSMSPSVQISAAYHAPDGTKKRSTFSHSAIHFVLSDDRRSATCQQMSIKFNPSDLSYKVKYDASPAMLYEFDFVPVDGGFQMGDGGTSFSSAENSGYVSARFIPKAKLTGSITYDDKSEAIALDGGHGLLVHAVQMNPHHVARWNFGDLQSEKDGLVFYQFELPEDNTDYEVGRVATGAVIRNHKLVGVTLDGAVRQVERTMDDEYGYNIPTKTVVALTGKTENGEDITVDLTLSPTNSIDKIDLLSELPWIIRTFVQTFLTKPIVYQWLQDAKAEVSVGKDKFTIQGKIFYEVVLMAEIPV